MRSSSILMKLMLGSQNTCVKHALKQLIVGFEPASQSFESVIVEFIGPYASVAKQKSLRVVLRFANEIPDDICVDWQIYHEILFHLMQNAVKFSKSEGEIRITVSYSPIIS